MSQNKERLDFEGKLLKWAMFLSASALIGAGYLALFLLGQDPATFSSGAFLVINVIIIFIVLDLILIGLRTDIPFSWQSGKRWRF